MALNTSGAISLAGATTGESIAVELGQSASGVISLNDTNVRSLAQVPSGAIIMPTNFYGKSSAGEASYLTPGTYTFVVPTGITEICCVAVAGGSGVASRGAGVNQLSAFGGGGALSFSNAIPTTPGESLTVFVGAGGQGPSSIPVTVNAGPGQDSYLARGSTRLVSASTAATRQGNAQTGPGVGGLASTGVGAVRYSGGSTGSNSIGVGGGGAAGYGGIGGTGGNGGSVPTTGTSGTGGSGAGGSGSQNLAGSGGGVGIIVQGASGVAGTADRAGSGGSFAFYGGGGPGHGDPNTLGGSGGPGTQGAVRIIYGGGKTYPNNSTI